MLTYFTYGGWFWRCCQITLLLSLNLHWLIKTRVKQAINTALRYYYFFSWFGELTSKQLLIYTFTRCRATLAFIWNCLSPPTVSPIFTLLLAQFWSSPSSEVSGSLAVKCSIILTSSSLTLSLIWCWVVYSGVLKLFRGFYSRFSRGFYSPKSYCIWKGETGWKTKTMS